MHIQELYLLHELFFCFYVGFALGPFTASFGGVSGGGGARVTFFKYIYIFVQCCVNIATMIVETGCMKETHYFYLALLYFACVIFREFHCNIWSIYSNS